MNVVRGNDEWVDDSVHPPVIRQGVSVMEKYPTRSTEPFGSGPFVVIVVAHQSRGGMVDNVREFYRDVIK